MKLFDYVLHTLIYHFEDALSYEAINFFYVPRISNLRKIKRNIYTKFTIIIEIL